MYNIYKLIICEKLIQLKLIPNPQKFAFIIKKYIFQQQNCHLQFITKTEQ